MKRTLLLIFLLSTFTSFSQSSSEKNKNNLDSLFDAIKKRENEAVGKQYPEFKFHFDNIEYSNSTLKGKIIFINFWFATCPPCLAEFDELNKLYAKFKDNSNFEFISFTFEDSEKIESIKKAYRISYTVISIPKEDCYKLNLNNGFPTSVILDKDGKIKLIHSGGSLVRTDIKHFFSEKYYPLISSEL